jgi:hypothetical protein
MKMPANKDRQNTVTHVSSIVMKRSIVPPRLQHKVAPITSKTPVRKVVWSAIEVIPAKCEHAARELQKRVWMRHVKTEKRGYLGVKRNSENWAYFSFIHFLLLTGICLIFDN